MSGVLEDLTEDQREIVGLVRQFVDEQVIPVASEYEHADAFPDDIVTGLRELGIFGFTIPERYGGLGLDLTTYALAVCELSRGWMSVSGIINTHFIVADMLLRDGTDEQRERFLPRMATGELRCAFSMTEPECGSDVQAIRSRATRDGDDYVVNGQKMWVTNGLRSGMVATLVKTDPDAEPAAPGHGLPAGREGAGRVARRRAGDPAAAAEARLQGRRDDGARLQRPPRARPKPAGRRARGAASSR